MPQPTQDLTHLAQNADGTWNSKYPTGNKPPRIVVNGSGFGTKSSSSPAIFENFSGATDGQLLSAYDPTWVTYNGSGAIITDDNPRYSGHKSAFNDFSRGEFWTNYKGYPQTRSVYLSYWARINGFRETYDRGVIKHGRVNSSVAAGGGGIYNGEGNQTFGGVTYGTGGYPAWSGSENANNNLGEFSGLPIDQWFRIEYEIYLNDVDANNGFYNLQGDIFAGRQSGAIMQRKTGYSKVNYLLDSTLLGLETANPSRWYKPIVFAAATVYSVVVNGITCSWTSGGSIPTANEICTGLRLDVIATGGVLSGNTTVYQDELYIDWGKTSVYDSNFTLGHVFSLQVSDVYLDTSLTRFVVGNAATYAACTIKEPQPYERWTDTMVRLIPNHAAISGTKYLYFVNTTLSGTSTTLIGASTDGINYV